MTFWTTPHVNSTRLQVNGQTLKKIVARIYGLAFAAVCRLAEHLLLHQQIDLMELDLCVPR